MKTKKKTGTAKKPATKQKAATAAVKAKTKATAPKAQNAKAMCKVQPKATGASTKKAETTPKQTGKSPIAGKNSDRKAVSTKQPMAAASKATATKKTAANQPQKANNGLVTVEIRIHNDAKGGHPHIMVDTVDDKNVSVGTTHAKFKGNNHPNIPLEHNPLGKKEKAYMHREGTVDSKQNYRSTSKTGKMTASDSQKAKSIGAKAKQKYLNKQKAKK